MDFLIQYAGEIILGLCVIVSRMFGRTKSAEYFAEKLRKKKAKRKKKLTKKVTKEAAKLENDLEQLKECD